MRRLMLLAALGAAALVTGATAAPQTAVCKDCPPYNTRCFSDVNCGFNCGMTCQEVPNDYRRRCR